MLKRINKTVSNCVYETTGVRINPEKIEHIKIGDDKVEVKMKSGSFWALTLKHIKQYFGE